LNRITELLSGYVELDRSNWLRSPVVRFVKAVRGFQCGLRIEVIYIPKEEWYKMLKRKQVKQLKCRWKVPRELKVGIKLNKHHRTYLVELKNDNILHKNVGNRQIKYLNNIIEQDNRSISRIVNSMLGFQSFRSANKTLKEIEAMNMIKKDKSII